MTARDADADADAYAHWEPTEDGWCLRLAGSWRGVAGSRLVEPPVLPGAAVIVDATALRDWDSALAARLWQLLAPLRRRGVEVRLDRAPEGLRDVLDLALPKPGAGRAAADLPPADITGARAQTGWADAMTTARFFGEVLLALLRLLRGRRDMRGSDLLRQLDDTGPLSVPIVSLTCGMVGLMLAYMGGAQLDRIGAPGFVADVVTVGMVRELAGMMTGVILAGRIGAAFAAQLASMQAGEEIDALRALGVDPVGHLVLPRLLALVLVAPLLIAYAALVGVLAGLPAAILVYGIPAGQYLHGCLAALTWTHLWIGIFKGTLYAALVALAGCREGLHAGRDAQAVGEATTRAVVKALVWIVAAACLTTVTFQSLGL